MISIIKNIILYIAIPILDKMGECALGQKEWRLKTLDSAKIYHAYIRVKESHPPRTSIIYAEAGYAMEVINERLKNNNKTDK